MGLGSNSILPFYLEKVERADGGMASDERDKIKFVARKKVAAPGKYFCRVTVVAGFQEKN